MRIDPINLSGFVTPSTIPEVSPVTSRPGIDPSTHDEHSNPSFNSPANSNQSPDNLTPDTVRDVLIELGINPDNESITIAESMSRLGLPLNDQSILDARSTLARFPGTTPEAYALARALDIPLSASTLRALTQIVNATVDSSPVPQAILDQLGVSLPASANSDQVVRELYQMVSRLGRSTEHTLSIVPENPNSATRALFHADPRSQLLLTLALNPNLSKDVTDSIRAQISHIEGQQLINQSSLTQTNTDGDLYFAFPIGLNEPQTAFTELLVRKREDEKSSANHDPEAVTLQTTLRMNTPRLGKMEVKLTGNQNSRMNVGVSVEKVSTLRYIKKNANELVSGLTRLGWTIKSFDTKHQTSFEPLWHGGAQLKHPRYRIDKTA
jgi:hypothetical protein